MRRARIIGFLWFLAFVYLGWAIPAGVQRLLEVPGRTASIVGAVAGAVVGLWFDAETRRRARGAPPRQRTAMLLFVGWLLTLAVATTLVVAAA